MWEWTLFALHPAVGFVHYNQGIENSMGKQCKCNARKGSEEKLAVQLFRGVSFAHQAPR
jgi:hypothetical protein